MDDVRCMEKATQRREEEMKR